MSRRGKALPERCDKNPLTIEEVAEPRWGPVERDSAHSPGIAPFSYGTGVALTYLIVR
jgi:hypothetical protein